MQFEQRFSFLDVATAVVQVQEAKNQAEAVSLPNLVVSMSNMYFDATCT